MESLNNLAKLAKFDGKFVMLGFGIIGQGVLPLILSRIDMQKKNIRIVSHNVDDLKVSKEYNLPHMIKELTVSNYKETLDDLF